MRNKKLSTIKRILFFTDLLGLEWTDGHEKMVNVLGTGFTLLDPLAPNQGIRWSRMGLRININPVDLKNKVIEYSK
jgi:predicted transcriptional regulator of viral defense system